MTHDPLPDSAALAVLKEALPVLQRASKHYDCEDCWYSCSTLTCDDGRASTECDCGAAEAIVALRQVEALIVTLEADHAE